MQEGGPSRSPPPPPPPQSSYFQKSPVQVGLKIRKYYNILLFCLIHRVLCIFANENTVNQVFRKRVPFCKSVLFSDLAYESVNFFKFKDRPSKKLRSGFVYKFSCGNCNVTYYGKTMRHLNVRALEHMCVFGKITNSLQSTAV